MPDIQNGYPTSIDAAREGMVANAIDADTVSGSCEVANVGFGIAMIHGDNPDGFKLGAAGYFKGVTIRDRSLPPENGDKFQIGSGVALIQKGTIWVKTGAACVAGNPVYRTAAGVLTPTAAGNTLIDRAFFETAADANALARVRLH